MDTWAKRLNSIKDEDDEGDKEFDFKLHEKRDIVCGSGTWGGVSRTEAMMMRRRVAMHQFFDDIMETQTKQGVNKETSENFGQIKNEITGVDDKLFQLIKVMQEKSEQQDYEMTRFNKETTVLKKQLAELKEVVEGNHLKSVKAELKKDIQTQKDTAKEVSEIKGQLNTVYGMKFFDRKE